MKKQQSISLFILIVIGILFLWQCPVEKIFGIPCPGCMMTTAVYYFIQFDFKSAFYFNPALYLLLVMALPLFLAYRRNKKVFIVLLYITFILWFLIYVYRMITIFPEFPMPYVKDNMIERVLNVIR